MSAERISVPPHRMRGMCGGASAPIQHEHSRQQARSAIVGRRLSLVPEEVGRLGLFSNAREPAGGLQPPLLLLHGIHPSASAHELRLLFESFRDERRVYAPDLPGFGSSERVARDYTPELYVRAIESLIDHAARSAGRAIDVVAIGLTCEYAAQAVVHRPEQVRSLVLLSPTGFAVKREQGSFERASRRGKSLWPLSLIERVGGGPLLFRVLVSKPALRLALRRTTRARVPQALLQQRYASAHQPGAEHAVRAMLVGGLVPQGNPQSIYTRVHCPTLVVRPRGAKTGFGSLDTFVKWREHFAVAQVDDASLLHAASAKEVEDELRTFWLGVPDEQPELPLAAASSY
jgi:pimeloyl-ACP methyl ester carboxylesterase